MWCYEGSIYDGISFLQGASLISKNRENEEKSKNRGLEDQSSQSDSSFTVFSDIESTEIVFTFGLFSYKVDVRISFYCLPLRVVRKSKWNKSTEEFARAKLGCYQLVLKYNMSITNFLLLNPCSRVATPEGQNGTLGPLQNNVQPVPFYRIWGWSFNGRSEERGKWFGGWGWFSLLRQWAW